LEEIPVDLEKLRVEPLVFLLKESRGWFLHVTQELSIGKGKRSLISFKEKSPLSAVITKHQKAN